MSPAADELRADEPWLHGPWFSRYCAVSKSSRFI